MDYSKIITWLNHAKKKYKDYSLIGLFAVVGLLIFGYIGLGWFGGSTESDTDWLVVLHADKAEIVTTSEGTFLTFSNVSEKTVFFSDRPERKYQSVDTSEFIANWDTLFADSPPNAALVHSDVGVDTEVVVIELFTPVVTVSGISFPIKIIGGEYTEGEIYTDVNLFIDEIICVGGGVCFDLSTEEDPMSPFLTSIIWYSCYSGSGVDYCLERKGKYSSGCSNLENYREAYGMSCKAVCDRSDSSSCSNGCYSDRQLSESTGWNFSTFACAEHIKE